MREAIIGLIGVVVGGLIGIVGQFFINFFDNKRWEKEKRIEHLRIKRSDLELKYEKCINSLYESLESNTYNADSVFDALIFFPENVREAYMAVPGNDSEITTRKKAVWNVSAEMKKSLVKINDQIEEEINKSNIKIFNWKL